MINMLDDYYNSCHMDDFGLDALNTCLEAGSNYVKQEQPLRIKPILPPHKHSKSCFKFVTDLHELANKLIDSDEIPGPRSIGYGSVRMKIINELKNCAIDYVEDNEVIIEVEI
jgi:hypothetical protein